MSILKKFTVINNIKKRKKYTFYIIYRVFYQVYLRNLISIRFFSSISTVEFIIYFKVYQKFMKSLFKYVLNMFLNINMLKFYYC